jgi:hypothetical protein
MKAFCVMSGQAADRLRCGAEFTEISRKTVGVASAEKAAPISGNLFAPPLPPSLPPSPFAYLITAVNKLHFVIKYRQIT